MDFQFRTSGVCAQAISFSIDDNKCLRNVVFYGGCPGNLKAISTLVEGKDAEEVAMLLKGNVCGNKPTSCADQLSCAISEALKKTSEK